MYLQMEKCKQYGFLIPNDKFITGEILKENGFITIGAHIFVYEEGIWYDEKFNLENSDDMLSEFIEYVYKKEEEK